MSRNEFADEVGGRTTAATTWKRRGVMWRTLGTMSKTGREGKMRLCYNLFGNSAKLRQTPDRQMSFIPFLDIN